MNRARNTFAPRPPATPWLAAALLGMGMQAMAVGAIAVGVALGAASPRPAPTERGPAKPGA